MLAGNIGHAHNEYLHTIAETGLIGFLSLVMLLWYFLFRTKLHEKKQHYMMLVSLKGSLIAVLTSGLFAFPFHILPTLINFITCFVIFIVLSHSKIYLGLIKSKSLKVSFASIFMIATLWISYSYFSGQEYKKEWNRAIYHTVRADFDVANEIYESLHPFLDQNGEFLFMYGSLLSAQGKHERALPILHSAESKFSDPNLFLVIGGSYEANGDYQSAISYYYTSWHIIPHKFYPLYKLMLAYHNKGDYTNSKFIAKQIIEMDEKIPSPATQQIKREAQEYLADSITD
ncbi:MAG: hypothetical protein LAT57_09185 [Balneolales bacterium]|nr:hypothetical protein [Balneolales bacterium]